MKTLMIVNPVSGGGSSLRILPRIKKCFEDINFKYDLVFTSKNRSGSSMAKANSEKYQMFIVVGGDGAVNDVINGVMLSRKRPKIAIIPAGTGNAYSITMQIPKSIDVICRKIAKPKFRKVDVIHLKKPGIYAIAFFGFGFDANVLALRNWMRIPGIKGYLLPFIWSLFRNLKYHITLHMNGKIIKQKIVQIVVSNSPYYGGGIMLCPKAKVDDGLLDITTYNLSRLDFIRNAKGILFERKKKLKRIHFYKAEEMKIRVRHKIPVQYDGQELRTRRKSFHLEILPKAVDVVWFH
jgi:YegS/Rv2252/BmrU family lipid kinase